MENYSYYIGFLTLVQIAVTFDFGLLFLNNTSVLNKVQGGLLQWIRERYDENLKAALREYGKRVKTHMPPVIQAHKEKLKALCAPFYHRTDYEVLPAFMSGIGITSGIHCIMMLLLVPMWQGSNYNLCISLFALITQSVTFSHILSLLTIHYRSAFQKEVVCILYALLWMSVYFLISLVLFLLGCTWKCLAVDVIFYWGIVIAYAPILVYIGRLFSLYVIRARWSCQIKHETITLRTLIDDYLRK